MPVVAINKTMSSAEFAQVEEVTAVRVFRVTNEDGSLSAVSYVTDRDELYCAKHKDEGGCSCTTRVRLCGILTHTVTKDAKWYRIKRNK
jgi:hypothetical protein